MIGFDLRIHRPASLIAAFGLFLAASPARVAAGDGEELAVRPAQITLAGAEARQQLIVSSGCADDSSSEDVTRQASFVSRTPDVVEVDEHGVARPTGDGAGRIVVEVGDRQTEVEVTVRDGTRPRPITLERDILPILTRAGCNAGPCHGKARGQNGFQLSLLGFDADFDFESIVQQNRGRRVFPASPDRSLLLLKPSGAVPHGGGVRLERDSPGYAIVRRWIAEGFPRDDSSREDTPVLDRVTVEPIERLFRYHEEQQLIVTAYYSDRTSRDVTHLAAFQSSESPVVAVDEHGLMRAGPIPGEAAIMARYQGEIAVSSALIPLPGEVPKSYYEELPRHNFIDGLVWKKLERLGLTASEPADDATFLRRAYIDAIGRLPTPAETRAFLADSSPGKRVRLVDELLDRPEYADHWANQWADLLRPNPYRVGIKAVFNLDVWLRDAFRRDLPYDEFVRRIVTAQGSTFRDGAATVFRDRRSPEELVTLVSQLFLGIRLECAKCHHHPFEKWSQEDFYSLAAYFARVGHKGRGLSPPISGSEEMIFVKASGSVKHPRTDEVLPPRPLFGAAPEIEPDSDPRAALVEWMLSPENPYVARVQVNRVWADLLGRGLVEPVDDLRATNPPSNAELLDALAGFFREQGYDQKELLRAIMTSYAYGLSSTPTERNVADTRNYSRHYRQRLRAETLLDAVSDITGVEEEFAAMAPGSRATEIWTHRTSSVFLDTFGRPDPNQDPPCERIPDTSVVQALHLMNSPGLHRKVTSDEGLPARLAASEKSPKELVEEVYLYVYCRFPTPEEAAVCERLFAEVGSDSGDAGETREPGEPADRRRVLEDLLWALLNTPEFVFKD